MSAFRRRPDMLVLRPALALLPHRYHDNSMPPRDWSEFDAPAWTRWSRHGSTTFLASGKWSVLLRRQAS